MGFNGIYLNIYDGIPSNHLLQFAIEHCPFFSSLIYLFNIEYGDFS